MAAVTCDSPWIILGNIREYRNKYSAAKCVGVSSATFTYEPGKLPNTVKLCMATAITPFKIIQGHRFWYQSKAHMRLPINH